jgi:hypothetical protein
MSVGPLLPPTAFLQTLPKIALLVAARVFDDPGDAVELGRWRAALTVETKRAT